MNGCRSLVRWGLGVVMFAGLLLATGAARGDDKAIGGDIVTNIVDGGIWYRMHVFTNTTSHTFEVLVDDLEVEYLIVAGGGGGGCLQNNTGTGAGACLRVARKQAADRLPPRL